MVKLMPKPAAPSLESLPLSGDSWEGFSNALWAAATAYAHGRAQEFLSIHPDATARDLVTFLSADYEEALEMTA